jgi:outer membrane protein TolC
MFLGTALLNIFLLPLSPGECLATTALAIQQSKIVIGPLISASKLQLPSEMFGLPLTSDSSIITTQPTRNSSDFIESELLRLNLTTTLQLAIHNNRDVQIATLFPTIAREAGKSTASVHDPAFFAENSYYRTDRPIQSTLDNGTDGSTGNDALEEDGWLARTGIRKALPTGGIGSVYIETDYLDSNSELILPNPQYTSRLTVQLRQALLKERGDKTNSSNIQVAGINVKIAEEQYKKNLAEVLKDVAAAYWRFTYYQKQLQISREGVAVAEEIFKRLASKHKLGLANLLDIDRADAVLQDRRLNSFADIRNYKTAMDQLKLLLGFPHNSKMFMATIEPTEQIVYSTGQLDRIGAINIASNSRPEMEIARLEIESAEIETKLADHKKLPTFDATASYSYNGLGENGSNSISDTIEENQASWTIGFEFEYPIGNQKTKAEYRKATLLQKRKKLELLKTQEQISFEIQSASSKIEELSAEIEASTGVSDAYERVLQREATLFEIARIDNQRLLDAQDDFYQARRNTLRAVLNLNIALLDLSWAKGTLIEDLDIDLNQQYSPLHYAEFISEMN